MKRPDRRLIAVASLTILSILALSAFVWGDTPPPVPTPALSTPAAAVSSPTATAVTPSPGVNPTPTPLMLLPGTFENAVLGYRITLPIGYRLARGLIFHTGEALGVDLFTRQTEQQAQEECLRDSGDIGVLAERIGDIRVGVYRNDARNLSAFEWATTPQAPGAQPRSTHHKVERTTVNGLEAVRLVQDRSGETSMFVIRLVRGRDYIYEVGLESGPIEGAPKSYLDDIVRTFAVIPPAPFPSPTPTTPPRDAADQLAQDLRDAFGAKDADAVARLMPGCWINVYPLIDGESPGGVKYRSVSLFTQSLRDRFAKGDLTVVVDGALQTSTQGGREEFYVRSDWRETDRTTRVDLYLGEVDGRWLWTTAVHHYRAADLVNSCIPYRSPWADGPC